MDAVTLADPGTVLGMLQRGRGAGAAGALRSPSGADEVTACILHDCRWDGQTESRDLYLARLAHRLEIPLGPLLDQIGTDEAESPDTLALAVLTLLALAGRPDAVEEVRGVVAAGRGEAVLSNLAVTDVEDRYDLRSGLVREFLARHDDADLAARIDGDWEPWGTLARTEPRVARLLDEWRHTRESHLRAREPVAPVDGLTIAELVDLVRRGHRGHVVRALREIGRRRDPVLVDLAEDPALRNAAGVLSGLGRALIAFGPLALPQARAWAVGDDPALIHPATTLLAAHGEAQDAPVLRTLLADALDAGEWCAAEDPARGLGRVRDGAAFDALVRGWETTEHSIARAALLEGLHGCDPEAARAYVDEGFDDCEPTVQELAVDRVPSTAAARRRLRDLHDDPFAPELREPIAARLRRIG